MGPIVAGALASGAIGGVTSLLGGRSANRARAGEAAKDRSFQSAEADKAMSFASGQTAKQMAFQERMSGSEWQRGVADMEAAGINPALAYQQGGASSPGGASAGGSAGSGSRATQEDVITPAVASAMQYSRLQQELKNMRATEEGIRATTTRTRAETDVARGRWQGMLSRGLTWMRGGWQGARGGMGSTAKSIARGMRESFDRMKPGGSGYKAMSGSGGDAPITTLRMYYGRNR